MPEFEIRNFCIIAHIDHGKSTLADRLLERTGAITQREMEAQFLDDMDLEKERGITIKASAVTVSYTHPDTHKKYMLNLIDTPGHVDFHYEVAKALQACEGALLLCDATQGVQAQTVANAYAAIEQDLEIIPVINKIDLPSADADRVAEEMEQVLGIDALMCAPISAKTGAGVDDLLKLIAEKLPGPGGDATAPLQALIFDSKYDDYRGVIVYVRVINGVLKRGQKIRMMGKNTVYAINDLGKFMPKARPVEEIGTGEVGFIIANIKTIQDVNIGDTVTDSGNPAPEPLKGYREPKQMVFCDFYPGANTEYTQLRRLKDDKLAAYALEAAQQCEVLAIPRIAPEIELKPLVESWRHAHGLRRLILADESAPSASPVGTLSDLTGLPVGLLVGPEGGFSDAERRLLLAQDFVVPISLGPRILRADTAAVAALALVQAIIGDWR